MTAISFPRNRAADLLKGVAVILMIQVHLMELFAHQDIYDSIVGKISLFLGGMPAAPVFMLVMGYYVAKSKKTFAQSIIRGLKIILLGFTLNIGLNLHLLINIATGIIDVDPLPYIFGVDILFLAGLSIIGLSLLKFIRFYQFLFYSIVLILIFIIQFVFKNRLDSYSENYLLAFIYGEGTWWSYFPFIPWFAYPLTGFVFYKLEQNLSYFIQKNIIYIFIVYLIVVILFIDYGSKISTDLELYYHHNYVFFIYTTFFLIAWSAMAYYLTGKYSNTILNYIEWFGKYVTAAYVIQWLIIGNIATALYKTQDLMAIILWFVSVLGTTSGGVWLWTKKDALIKKIKLS